MGRIIRHPPKPKPKPKLLHEVRVGTLHAKWKSHQTELWTEVARIAGHAGYTKHQPFWAYVAIYFDTPEKVEALKRWLSAVDFDGKQEAAQREPCQVSIAYEKAALAQHAVLWGLSTGILRDVVQAYRRVRLSSSAHGIANFAAAEVIIRRCPHMDTYPGRDRARDLAEHMLVYIEARHRAWFWNGLEHPHALAPFQFYK